VAGTVPEVKSWIEWRESDDPWRGLQPKYEKLVRRGPSHFALVTKSPAGPVFVRLVPLAFRDRRTR
jgi:hypothetical protein